ncbi:hypothetical protein FocnCong_v015199 [Fusarium oxysporum f. sp. conglutinans]|nr:hypothetical protein FocnCong_v015199 [Fusarium oxysporum f. sp. conglutinans]
MPQQRLSFAQWSQRSGSSISGDLLEFSSQQSDDLDISQKSKCLSSRPRTVSTTSSTKPRTSWVFSHMPDEEVETRYYNQRTGKEEWRCKHCDKTAQGTGVGPEDHRQGRIEKRYHQRKRGKRAKPVGEYIHNVSLEELREQHTEDVNAGNKAQQRLQLRNLRSFAIRQMNEIRDEWRKKKEVIVNGVEKRLQFKQWLEHTGKDVEYASYDASRAEIRSQLNKKEDFFTIDTQLAPEAREAIRKARFADKPLSSADLSRLLCSDDTVDFTLTQAPADQDEDEDNDLSDEDDLKMPSSPPCLLDRESSLLLRQCG